MRQRVGWKATIESVLGALAECHASAELAGLEAVVTNSVFWDEWITRIPASIQGAPNLGRASQGSQKCQLALDGGEIGII